MVYFDNAATTPVPKAVADAMYDVLTQHFGKTATRASTSSPPPWSTVPSWSPASCWRSRAMT